MNRPTIAISTGDPAGIGPEITMKALADASLRQQADWVVFAHRDLLHRATRECRLDDVLSNPGVRVIEPAESRLKNVARGRPSADAGAAALAYVRLATLCCLDGLAGAMVTAPINKQAVTMTGVAFTGHTEFIAELCGRHEPRMMLINDKLAVVHVTTHQSLRSACEIDVPRVVETLRVGRIALHRLIGAEPRAAVCGLNPHAGESGLFGDEDARVIKPAVEIALTEGMNVTGPLPADTVFLQAVRGRFDLVIAMYHDQGHIPMKLIDFEHTVNVSLNLPIVRTSVDHGTAYDIAGNNLADPTSMKSAMRLALKLASGCRSSVGNPLDRRMK